MPWGVSASLLARGTGQALRNSEREKPKHRRRSAPEQVAWEAPRHRRRRASSRNGKEGRGEESIETRSALAQHLQNGWREGQGLHRQEKEPRAAATLGAVGRASIWLLPTKIVTYAYWRKLVGNRKVVKHKPQNSPLEEGMVLHLPSFLAVLSLYT